MVRTCNAQWSDFPDGLLAAMTSTQRHFLLFSWRDIVAAARPRLN